MFAVPFSEIAPIVGRSPTGVRQLACYRVCGAVRTPGADLRLQREVVDAFLATSRGGDFDALMAVFDPDVAFHVDRSAVQAEGQEKVCSEPSVARLYTGSPGQHDLRL